MNERRHTGRPGLFILLFVTLYFVQAGLAGGEPLLTAQRSFGDQDLKKYSAPGSGGSPTSEGTAQGKPSDAAAAPEPRQVADSQYWCDTAARHRQEVVDSKQDLGRAEEDLRLANDVILYRKEVNEATLDALNKAREGVEAARQRVQSAEERQRAFEEEARAKRIPPGWLECRFE